jgi:hypothetical protein
MRKKNQSASDREQEASTRTPTFLLELPLRVNTAQAARLRAHLEAGRQFYNAILSLGLKRLRAMRADSAQARLLVPSHMRRNENARQLLRSCGSSMAFRSTPCTRQAKPGG